MRQLAKQGFTVLLGEPNAQGVLPELMKQVRFRDVKETAVIPTPTGSISLYRAERGP